MSNLAPNNFLPQLRLKASKDFQQIYRSSQRIVGKNFTMLIRSNSFDHLRLGLSVSKKRVRNAVQRNRLKRIVRESCRCLQSQIRGIDIVVIANKASDTALNKELFENLEKQWKRLISTCQKV